MDDQCLIDVGGVRLAYRTWGDPSAQPIILLHGLGSDGSTWDETAGDLADLWHLYAPDLRGHGRIPAGWSDWSSKRLRHHFRSASRRRSVRTGRWPSTGWRVRRSWSS
ncbi:alpha/beta fold hydrolase [Nonomuraea guangzhouensis]|uniref:Alpha/beta fold hydrolase n=1 Tax=Nonomuraea guangzhouensis TaxID=1291555 RepID=A0ABW4G2M5_9ACTN